MWRSSGSVCAAQPYIGDVSHEFGDDVMPLSSVETWTMQDLSILGLDENYLLKIYLADDKHSSKKTTWV